MENILDFKGKQQDKSSWKRVLITNGIILCIPLYFCYYYAFIETSDRHYQIEDIIIYSLFFTCIWTVILNALCLFISLFFSKTYWKKWLAVVVGGIILFLCTLGVQFILDFNKIIN
jgi:hypothetical protein